MMRDQYLSEIIGDFKKHKAGSDSHFYKSAIERGIIVQVISPLTLRGQQSNHSSDYFDLQIM